MIKVIDNFLEEDQFDHLQSIIFTDGFCMFSPQEPQVTITIK